MEQLKNNLIVLKEKLDIMRNKLDDVYKNFEKNMIDDPEWNSNQKVVETESQNKA